MTSQEHIIKFCDMLKELWLAHPELRFGQLIGKAMVSTEFLVHADDIELLDFLKETYGTKKEN